MQLLRRPWFVTLVFFVVPAIAYAGLVTNFTFDPFGPAYAWQAYNYYALALVNGTQAVPADVIHGEGLFVGGRVYLYYGVLPAVLRLPLIPFVDLTETPVSQLIQWLMVVIGQGALQLAVLRVYFVKQSHRGIDAALLVLVSAALWFGSGAFLIAQNANLYHEPYAAAVMLTSIFIAMLVRDFLVEERRPAGTRLLAYAALAGLCVFARQTYAVGLYLATLALLLPVWRDFAARPAATLARAVPPLAVLFAFGALYLGLNYARFGSLGTGWTVADYGYYIAGIEREKLETMIGQHFSAARIVPNLIYTMIGSSTLREQLITMLGGGVAVTYNVPVRHLIFMPVTLLFAAGGLVALVRRLRATGLVSPLPFVTLGLLATAMLQMAYATMNWRYTAELSPVLIWLMLIAMRDVDPGRLLGRFAWLAAGLLAVATAVSLAYMATLRPLLLYDHPKTAGSLMAPLSPELVARATAPGARDPRVVATRLRLGNPLQPPQ